MSRKTAAPCHPYARAVPTWDTTGAAKLIADASLPFATAHSQIRRFVTKGWLPTRGKRGSGPMAAYLFGPEAVAGAKVLSVLTELGTDQEIIARVWAVLYRHGGWRLHLLPEGEAPVLRAIVDALKGKSWVLQIEVRRGDQTGELFVRPLVFDPAGEVPASWAGEPEVLPRATITVELAPLLLPLHRQFMEAIGGGELVATLDLAPAGAH